MYGGNPRTGLARLIACAGLLWAPLALAGTSFPVNITLSIPAAGGTPVQPVTNTAASGTCVNQTLSQAAHATVTVVCSTNQFVSIAPLPSVPYIGTHGGALRYMLTPGAILPLGDDLAWQAGTGTVTTLQVERKKWAPWDIAEIQISY